MFTAVQPTPTAVAIWLPPELDLKPPQIIRSGIGLADLETSEEHSLPFTSITASARPAGAIQPGCLPSRR